MDKTKSGRQARLADGVRNAEDGIVRVAVELTTLSSLPGDANIDAGQQQLAALDAELAYRGPERRSGPTAGLARLLASVLDEVDYGLVLIASDGVVVHANHAARAELADHAPLHLAGRHLNGRTPEIQRAFAKALASARDKGLRTMLTFDGAPSGAEAADRMGLSIVPLPAALSRAHAGHAVLITLQRRRIAASLSVDAFAREHGLSTREQQVLAALCDGQRAKDIALALKIGEATVRSHVNNLKVKTGCASIVDIVKKISRLPPMVTALR